jgi:hypothetical protein
LFHELYESEALTRGLAACDLPAPPAAAELIGCGVLDDSNAVVQPWPINTDHRSPSLAPILRLIDLEPQVHGQVLPVVLLALCLIAD